jgi:hypothetical protein
MCDVGIFLLGKEVAAFFGGWSPGRVFRVSCILRILLGHPANFNSVRDPVPSLLLSALFSSLLLKNKNNAPRSEGSLREELSEIM